MDRAGFAVLIVLTIALVRISDSQKDATGGKKEDADAGRADWDQRQSRDRSQGHSPGRPEDAELSSPQTKTSPRPSRSGILVRLPRGTSSQGDGRHTSIAAPALAAGASQEDLVSAPRDGRLRTARHPASQQHRTKVNRRQSSKLSSTSARRLAG